MVTRRVQLLFACVVVGLLVPLGRLLWLQVLSPDAGLAAQARERQYYQTRVEPFRGDIRCRGGALLATDRLSFEIAVRYDRFRPPEPRWLQRMLASAGRLRLNVAEASQALESAAPEWAASLARAAGAPLSHVMGLRQAVIDRVTRIREHLLARNPSLRRRRHFRIKEETVPQPVLSGADLQVVSRIMARPRSFPDLIVVPTRTRHYPMGRLACHVIGRLGVVSRGHEPPAPPGHDVPGKEYLPGDEYGVQGIEKQYDWTLRGVRGWRTFRKRRRPGEDELIREDPAKPGRAIVLSLDLEAQRSAEAALGDRAGAVVVLDVHTGEVLVCASSPGYDLALANRQLARLFDRRPGPLVNRAIRGAVPGGSVVKIATAIAGLQTGKITPHTSFVCRGAYSVGDATWRCEVHGNVDVARAIEHSCNVFFCHVARRTGPGALALWARRMGLGVRAGVDLPWEKRGRFPDPAWMGRVLGRTWRLGHTLNTCIGQGDVLITPMQTAIMMAAVANGGKVLWPRMLRAGETANAHAGPRHCLALKPEGLAAIRAGMYAVGTRGTARHIDGLAKLGIAGKTGTAETRDPSDNHAWFAGFAPYRTPRYAFAAVVYHTPLHGADAAAPVARDTLRPLLERRPDTSP